MDRRGKPEVDGELSVALYVSVTSAILHASTESSSEVGVMRRSALILIVVEVVVVLTVVGTDEGAELHDAATSRRVITLPMGRMRDIPQVLHGESGA